jgi:hypothetical protein
MVWMIVFTLDCPAALQIPSCLIVANWIGIDDFPACICKAKKNIRSLFEEDGGSLS